MAKIRKSYTELEVSVPDIRTVGIHAGSLGIESVLVDGEPTLFEYYPHHQKTESNWNSVLDPFSSLCCSHGICREKAHQNLLINCCKPSKDLSVNLDSVTLDNGSQSSGKAKQIILLILFISLFF